MAEKNKKRGGRRAHLNDFHVNLAGDYVYTGAHYTYVDQGRSRDRVHGMGEQPGAVDPQRMDQQVFGVLAPDPGGGLAQQRVDADAGRVWRYGAGRA